MSEYFYQNHFKSWFDEGQEEPDDESYVHYISIGKLERYPNSPIEEAVRAAELASKNLKDPVLCLSGGLDSEAMALAFLGAGVKFRIAIMSFENSLNEYDTKFAVEFAKKHNIEFTEIKLNVLDILNNGRHLSLAEKYLTMSPERALFLMFLEKLEGEPVLAGEILRFEKKHNNIQLACPKHRDLCYWRYLKENNRRGIPYFHYYTPEFAYSFMAHTKISGSESVNTDWTGKYKEFYKHKFSIYRQAGFNVIDFEGREQKWHGYEGIKINIDQSFGSQEAYNTKFRKPLEKNPAYDHNQVLAVSDEDLFAHRVLENRGTPIGRA